MADQEGPVDGMSRAPIPGWAAPLLALVVAAGSMRIAWMSDDALINVRAALNAASGNGAVYNVGERVQTATSPGWFWLQYLGGRLTGEFVISSMLLGVALATAAAVALAVSARSTVQGLVVPAAFAVSPALLDYATGGLENAMGMAALAAWVLAWRRVPVPATVGAAALLGLTTAAVVATRLDYALLVAPAVLWWAAATARRRSWRALATGAVAGGVPAGLWAAASLAYYGDVLPNTFHAKTNLDIDRSEVLVSGLRYLVVSFEYDPLVLVVPLLATAAAVLAGSDRSRLIVAGMWLYVGYVVWIGGDFMAGRFLTGVLVLGLAVVAAARPPWWGASTAALPLAAGALAAVVLVVPPLRPWSTTADTPARWDFDQRGGVADEAGFYRVVTGSTLHAVLFRSGDAAQFTEPARQRGLRPLWELRRLEDRWSTVTPAPAGRRRPVAVACGGMGNAGLALGPAVHIVDTCALADPFLARLPYRPPAPHAWRIGHFERTLPEGYIEAVTYADAARVEDPSLRALLEQVWQRVRR